MRQRHAICAVVVVGAGVCAAMRVGADGYCRNTVVVAQNVIFENSKFEVENIKELPLDPTDIPLAKDARAKRPVDILERGIVEILAREHYSTKENSLTCPLLEGNVQMWLGSINVYERSEYDGDSDFCPSENVRNELCEFDVSRAAHGAAAPC